VLTLQRIFSGFPDGLRGVALLWLRLAVSSLLVWECVLPWGSAHPQTYVPLGLIALGLAVGFLTPLTCVVAAATQWVLLVVPHTEAWSMALLVTAVLLALAVLGPGAYSIDAWIFGRKKLRVGSS
jgi:hypothetical protein